MLSLLVILFLITAILDLLISSTRKLSRTLMFVALIFMYVGIQVYFSKVGGFPSRYQRLLLFGVIPAKNFSTLVITFEKLGILINVGRFLFPVLFLCCAVSLNYYTRQYVSSHKFVYVAIVILPMILFALSLPKTFSCLFSNMYRTQLFFVNSTVILFFLYIFAGISLIVWEYFSVQIPFFRNSFGTKAIFYIMICIPYLFFALFEPIFIYQDYSSMRIPSHFFLYGNRKNITNWLVVLVSSLLATFCLLIQTWTTYRKEFNIQQEELVIKGKMKTAEVSSSIILHGLKNQILTSEVLLNNLKNRIKDKTVDELIDVNKNIQERLDVLYRSFAKINTTLKTISTLDFLEEVKKKLKNTENSSVVNYSFDDGKILCDTNLLSEALYNVIVNAIEAVDGVSEPRVMVKLSFSRARVIISVSDNGPGISEEVKKNLFSPFVTTKNNSTNWGMGLCYTNEIIKKHQGTIRIESREGQGTECTITLPKV